jgi:prepilin-type N-terminal cleavage/methylation domain-containing protein
MNIYKNKFNKGFTLIELLVVIAIIGTLASIVITSLDSARSRARDSFRKQSLIQIRNALEMYANDNNGSYPSTGGAWWGTSTLGGGRSPTAVNSYVPGLVPNYISVLPMDPLRNTNGWDGFLYRSDGVNYKFINNDSLENRPSAGDTFFDPRRSSPVGTPSWAFMVCSAEPACSDW